MPLRSLKLILSPVVVFKVKPGARLPTRFPTVIVGSVLTAGSSVGADVVSDGAASATGVLVAAS